MYVEYYLLSDYLSVRSGTRTSARFRSAHTAAAASANCSPTVRWVMLIPINVCMYVDLALLHRARSQEDDRQAMLDAGIKTLADMQLLGVAAADQSAPVHIQIHTHTRICTNL
jgi:hypothetical protein